MDGFIIYWKKLEIKFEKSWSAVQIMHRYRTGRIFHLIFPDVNDIPEFLSQIRRIPVRRSCAYLQEMHSGTKQFKTSTLEK